MHSCTDPKSVVAAIGSWPVGRTLHRTNRSRRKPRLPTGRDLRFKKHRRSSQRSVLEHVGIAVGLLRATGIGSFPIEQPPKPTGKLILSPATLSAEQFEFNTDVGQVRANGNFELKNVNQLAAGTQLPDADFQMNGQLDLAGLMQMLPATFHTHEDLQVQSGVARFQIASQQRQLLVSLDMADLKASRGGEAIVWQEPIRVVGNIADTPAGLALTNLQAQTDFINVQGNASFSEAVFGVQGDLGLLTQRVGQFVDLQSMDFAGTINGKFGWQLSTSSNGTPQTFKTSPPLKTVRSI